MEANSNSWPSIRSSLKSVLETGKAMEQTGKMRE